MKKTETERYSTPQLDLAAFIKLYGIEPELRLRYGKVDFIFPVTGELHELIMRFHSNVEIPIIDYLVSYKTLKGQMLMLRDSQKH